MMDTSPDLEVGAANTVPQSVQVELYRFVKQLDDQYNFPHGLDIYYHLLSALNQYFKKLP